jgi:protein-tyrosine phosphatase
MTQRILFVCLGNIVRSPLAEAMFTHLAEQAGVAAKYPAESAGTAAWHVGEPPDPRMRRVAASHGLRYTHAGRQFERQDFERFDLIVAMDGENYRDLSSLARTPEHRQKIRMLREYEPGGKPGLAVPDPYYGGIDGFEEVYWLVERACGGLLEHLEGQG